MSCLVVYFDDIGFCEDDAGAEGWLFEGAVFTRWHERSFGIVGFTVNFILQQY